MTSTLTLTLTLTQVRGLRSELSATSDLPSSQLQARARVLVDAMALALQAATLLTHGHPTASAAFCASRLPPRRAAATNYGALLHANGDYGGASAERLLIDRLTPSLE